MYTNIRLYILHSINVIIYQSVTQLIDLVEKIVSFQLFKHLGIKHLLCSLLSYIIWKFDWWQESV